MAGGYLFFGGLPAVESLNAGGLPAVESEPGLLLIECGQPVFIITIVTNKTAKAKSLILDVFMLEEFYGVCYALIYLFICWIEKILFPYK